MEVRVSGIIAQDIREQLNASFREKLKTLSLAIWEGKAKSPNIDVWLSNFTGKVIDAESERTYALYLLTRFMYYAQYETQALLAAIYRDLFKYPLIAKIRRANGDSRDQRLIDHHFLRELMATRFLGLGGAAKSGPMLLYHFKKVTGLGDESFATVDAVRDKQAKYMPPGVLRYVFIDDLCGSGDQAARFNREFVEPMRKSVGSGVEIWYFVLFATTDALAGLRSSNTSFDRVQAVHELDDTFRCFGPESRYLPTKDLDLSVGKSIVETYGASLLAAHPLGYKDCQLLLGFSHNVPDDTLPIIWSKESSWNPIFKRF
jgi:hypothetical protein